MSGTPAQRERHKVVAYIQRRSLEMERAAKRNGLVSADEAQLLRRRVRALANEIERGFHL